YKGPASVRYPRGAGCGATPKPELDVVEIGKANVRREGQVLAILVFGSLLPAALQAAEQFNATVVDMRFVKPLDHALLLNLAATHQAFVSIEDAAIMGGAGSAVLEFFASQGLARPMLQLGLP